MVEWSVAGGVVVAFWLLVWMFARWASRMDDVSYDFLDGGMREPYGTKYLLILTNKDQDY